MLETLRHYNIETYASWWIVVVRNSRGELQIDRTIFYLKEIHHGQEKKIKQSLPHGVKEDSLQTNTLRKPFLQETNSTWTYFCKKSVDLLWVLHVKDQTAENYAHSKSPKPPLVKSVENPHVKQTHKSMRSMRENHLSKWWRLIKGKSSPAFKNKSDLNDLE